MLYSVESAHALLKRYITSSQGDLLTTWLQIQQAVSTQIQNIKSITAKERMRTPLRLTRVQYHACFGHVTNTALQLADLNYQSAQKPLKPCTGVFKATTGLPCAHKINDIQFARESLYPSDFHPHWHWDRYLDVLEPTLEPLRVVSYSASTSGRTLSTRRIPSGFEASETQERRCGLCNQPGHTRASMRCIVNIRRLQAEFAPHEPLESTSNPESASQVIPRATVQEILDSASRSTGQSALQSALQSVLDSDSQLIPKATIQRILESHPAPPPEPTPELELTPDQCSQ
jgi:histone H3/H4